MARMIFEDNEWILRDDWGVEDVRNVIDCNDIEEARDFTDEDCVNVLHIAARAFDANNGINWDAMDAAINQYITDTEKA